MRLRLGLRRLSRGRVAAIEGALLLPPGGALALIDLAVVIGVDLVEPFAEAAVAVGFGKAGKPIVIRLDLFEPRFLSGLQIGCGQLYRQPRLPAFDKMHTPVAILIEGDRLLAGRLRHRLGGLTGQPQIRGDDGGGRQKYPSHSIPPSVYVPNIIRTS